jgi:hypothetical protein
MRRLFLKLRRRHRLHADLAEELAFHRDMARGNDNHIPLGNLSRITEESLDLWRFSRLENLWRDLVYGARSGRGDLAWRRNCTCRGISTRQCSQSTRG